MEPITSSQEVSVCETCGDQGFTDAFVYCVNCLNVPIHRYCLHILPMTLDEIVIWHCEDCKPKVRNQVFSPELISSISKELEATNSKSIKTTHDKKKQKKKRDINSLIAGTKEVISLELKFHIPKKMRTKRKKIALFSSPKQKEDKLQNDEKTGCTNFEDLVKNKIFEVNSSEEKTDESQPSIQSCEHDKLISDSLHIKKESDKPTSNEYRGENGNNVSRSLDFKNIVQETYYRHAQPVLDPIWRGSFNIVDKDYNIFEGFVGHLSNKACDKVLKEAAMLSPLLQLELHAKSVLWPKSFEECEPSDDNIALYFFPGDQINEKNFDQLVSDMIDEGLAMRATATNADLLIFTSTLLPKFFWRFQGKYYLWGVFRGKKKDSTLVSSNGNECDLSKDSPNVKEILTRMKTLDARSPRSPLSNNGENGVDMDQESGD